MFKQKKAIILAVIALALTVTGAFAWKPLKGPSQVNNNGTPAATRIEDKKATPEEISENAKKAGANELGQVPIFVYHLIDKEEARWSRTPENFRNDLQELYDRNYVLVGLNDYITGNINIPAGKSPAVLTFDDSTPGHFRLLEKENGETAVDPDCAVGILKDFGEKHPGFGHTATFFINTEPFGQPQYWQKKLQLLNDWGFEIGNHTLNHQYLKGLPPEQVAEQIASLQTQIQQALPGYQPKAFAIVQDGVPDPLTLGLSGESNGVKYSHNGILWWAWSAAHSPFNKDYDPARIQRIQAFTDNGRNSVVNWLERISATRYVSDGRKDAIAAPEGWEKQIKENHAKSLVTYKKEEPSRNPGQDQMSSNARGLHVSFMWAESKDRWNKVLDLIDSAQLNTVQLDIKDESGRIGHSSKVKLAGEIGSSTGVLPVEDRLKDLKERGIYSIARIVVFRDPVLAQKRPELMVRAADGSPLAGGAWVDPYSKEVLDYNLGLTLEAYELGFDEVQFDYIRFPEGKIAKTAVYNSKAPDDTRTRVDVIADYLGYVRSSITWSRPFSATVFGFMSFAVDDQGIGQRPERMAPFVDYLSPMSYPSHYGPGNYGFSNPNAHPYEVLDAALKDFMPLVETTGCQLRPWLQAFTWGPPPYGRNEIRAQINATEDNGIKTWLLWDPAVNYKTGEIAP
ncbi:MAG: putative glycoside hydrolase [Bacillota bacterium]